MFHLRSLQLHAQLTQSRQVLIMVFITVQSFLIKSSSFLLVVLSFGHHTQQSESLAVALVFCETSLCDQLQLLE